jgi:TIR domain
MSNVKMSNSVFISYRRDVSEQNANAVYRELTYRGIDVFYDVENITVGAFDTQILTEIAARPYFLPILQPGTLNRCVEENDWVRREIEQAFLLNRLIVPLHTSEFELMDKPIRKRLTQAG